MVFCGREPTMNVPLEAPMLATTRPAPTTA